MPSLAPRSPREVPISLIGHPFASTGRGEELRAAIRALRRVGANVEVLDIFRFLPRTDPAHQALLRECESETLPRDGIRLFFINADEVEPVLAAMSARALSFEGGYNIIVPAWELPRFPDVWQPAVGRFDEVWAISRFVAAALAAADLRCHHVGQAAEIEPSAFLPRRHFELRESAFTFLGFFDTTSYVERKNPAAVIDLYRRLRARRPFDDIQLVLKAKAGEEGTSEWQDLAGADAPGIVIINEKLATHEFISLLSCADCLVSLHRSEGFGRGIAEAMSLGRLVLATGWSGNMDFTTAENGLLVDSTLVPVGEEQYPHWQNQSWAEPDIDHALHLTTRALDEPAWARAVARAGRCDAMRLVSHRAVGVRMLSRIEAICNGAAPDEPSAAGSQAGAAVRTGELAPLPAQ